MRLVSLLSRRAVLLLPVLILTGCAGLSSRPAADLPSLMVERMGWMDEVARVKQAKDLPVTDVKREAELLNVMARSGAEHGLPPAAVRAFFAGQIDAAKVYQREWLAQHARQPATPAHALPDLAISVRPALDDIGRRMLKALAAARATPERASLPAKAQAQLLRAGYSPAVVKTAVAGLQAGLK